MSLRVASGLLILTLLAGEALGSALILMAGETTGSALILILLCAGDGTTTFAAGDFLTGVFFTGDFFFGLGDATATTGAFFLPFN